MIKKIILTIVAVLVAGGALMIYGTYKAADEFVKTNEPQLRQYAQLDEAEQNKYVLDHADEILAQASASVKGRSCSSKGFGGFGASHHGGGNLAFGADCPRPQ